MAQRPASRGMGMGGPPPPTGGPRGGAPVAAKVPFGVAPMAALQMAPSNFAPVGMRPPTNAGRPGSSAGAVPQGMRPPTSGGFGGAGAGAAATPLQTDVNVVVRPMTGMASGVSGMPTKSLGPGRVIADKTYYLTDLNKKLNDIMRELDSMRYEMERTNADNLLYAQLERKYEMHMKEVRVLEGSLADFNLAFDKLRTNTNIAEIKDHYNQLRERNEREKRNVDEIFLKAQHQEKQTREVSKQPGHRDTHTGEQRLSFGLGLTVLCVSPVLCLLDRGAHRRSSRRRRRSHRLPGRGETKRVFGAARGARGSQRAHHRARRCFGQFGPRDRPIRGDDEE